MTRAERALAERYNETRVVSDFEEPIETIEVRRSVTISVRFTADEIAELRSRAASAGMKVTAFIRSAALEAERPPAALDALARATDALEEHIHQLREQLAAAGAGKRQT